MHRITVSQRVPEDGWAQQFPRRSSDSRRHLYSPLGHNLIDLL